MPRLIRQPIRRLQDPLRPLPRPVGAYRTSTEGVGLHGSCASTAYRHGSCASTAYRLVPALCLALVNAAWSVRSRHAARGSFPVPAEYQAMAGFLEQRTEEGELVLAAWDDFCGLFLFDRRNRYVAGFNVEFLHRTDPQRFRAYYLLYEGEVKEPSKTLARHFEGARIVLVRRVPRRPGEEELARTLASVLAFDELDSPAETWRVFRLRNPVRSGALPGGER